MKNRIEEEYNRREVKPIRLNKYISDAGICSRREADRLIEAGKVKIDGVTASCGMKVLPNQTVTVGKKEIRGKNAMVVLAVNKPAGCGLYRRHADEEQYYPFSGLSGTGDLCRTLG